MKRAKLSRRSVKPRNPYVASALQRKAGAHQRQDKRAGRARQQTRLRRELGKLSED